jgi:hypothetical protein
LDPARNGFLLSPTVWGPEWFAWIASTPWSDPQWQRMLSMFCPKTLRIVTESRWAFREPIHVRLHSLKFTPWDAGWYSFPASAMPLFELFNYQVKNSHLELRWLPGVGSALISPQPSRARLNVDQGDSTATLRRTFRQLSIKFGVLKSTEWTTGEIQFRVFALRHDESATEVWGRRVARNDVAGNPVLDSGKIPLSLDGVDALGFEIDGSGASPGVTPAWFGVEFFP